MDSYGGEVVYNVSDDRFTVDDQGVISNVKPLDADNQFGNYFNNNSYRFQVSMYS